MNSFTAVSPPGCNSGIWFQRRTVLFPAWLSSASTGHGPLISTRRPNKKDVICSVKTTELSKPPVSQPQDAIQRFKVVELSKPPGSSYEADLNTIMKSLDSLTSTVKSDVPSNPAAVSRSKPSRMERNPRKLSSSAAQANMPLGFLSIIRYPLATESAMKALLEFNTLIFMVDKRADKNTIKETFMKMFKVRAKKVNTLIMQDGSKKAFVMLAPEFSALDVAKKMKFM